jgi:hypothetical protein
VAEWRASGLSSPAYCAGKDFTAGGLRHWAHRLSRGEDRRSRMRIARVVRTSTLESRAAAELASGGAGLVVELGAARVRVTPGVDRATLATVIEVLTATARPREAR